MAFEISNLVVSVFFLHKIGEDSIVLILVHHLLGLFQSGFVLVSLGGSLFPELLLLVKHSQHLGHALFVVLYLWSRFVFDHHHTQVIVQLRLYIHRRYLSNHLQRRQSTIQLRDEVIVDFFVNYFLLRHFQPILLTTFTHDFEPTLSEVIDLIAINRLKYL